MDASLDPNGHFIVALHALGSALDVLGRGATESLADGAVRQDSEERVDELDVMLNLIKRAL